MACNAPTVTVLANQTRTFGDISRRADRLFGLIPVWRKASGSIRVERHPQNQPSLRSITNTVVIETFFTITRYTYR
jgi:hypothetical protein